MFIYDVHTGFICLSLLRELEAHAASLFNSVNCTKVTGKSAQIEPGKTGPQNETDYNYLQ